MKTAHRNTTPNMTVSDTAMVRARASLAKVALSSSQAKHIAKAAEALPDVAVMAGGQRPACARQATQQWVATA